MDVRLLEIQPFKVHGILAAPVCTAFSGAGARHWAAKAEAGNQQLLDGLALVDACLRVIQVHDPEWWVLENPVGRLRKWIGPPCMTFNPNEYAGWLGDKWREEAYTKRTCLWGKFIRPAKKSKPAILGSKMWSSYGGASERTKEMRSITPLGFSKAFFKSNP